MTNRSYMSLRDSIATLQAKLAKKRSLFADEVARHVTRRPLPGATQARLVTDVRNGIPFCCEAGYKNLAIRLDDRVWIDLLHAFAYEHMGCEENGQIDQDTAEEYAQKLSAFFDDLRSWGRARKLVEGLVP